MERRNFSVGRRERRRLSNNPDIVFQSPDYQRQVRIAFKGSATFAEPGEILAHTFVPDRSGNFIPNGEFIRFPDTPRNRDRLSGFAARKGCNQRIAVMNEQP